MRSFLTLLILALVAVTTVKAGNISGALTLSNALAGSTVTVTFSTTPTSNVAASGSLRIAVTNFPNGTPTCAFTTPSKASGGASITSGILSVTNDATQITAGAIVITCTGVVLPPSGQAAVTTATTTNNAQNGDVTDTQGAGTIPIILGMQNPAFSLSSTVTGGVVTATISFTAARQLDATTGTVTVNSLANFVMTPHCAWVYPVHKAAASSALASNVLTITNDGTAITARVLQQITCTGVTNPTSAQAAKTDVTITSGTGAIDANTRDINAGGSMPAIVAVASPAVTFSTTANGATSVTMTISLTATTALAATTGTVTVNSLANFVFTSIACSWVSPSAKAAASSAVSNNVLTVTNDATAIAAKVAQVITCTGVTNPANQVAKTDVTITSGSDSTSVGTMPAIVDVSGAAVTLSSNVAGGTGVVMTISYFSNSALNAAATVTVNSLANFAFTTNACSFVLPSAKAAASASFTTPTLTITNDGSAITARQLVTITCTGVTNPGTAQAAKADVTVTPGGVNSALGTLVAIVDVASPTITLASNLALASTTATISFHAKSALASSGTVKIPLFGFTSVQSCSFTSPSSKSAASTAFANNVATITNDATQIAARAQITIVCSVTNSAVAVATNTVIFESGAENSQIGTLVAIVAQALSGAPKVTLSSDVESVTGAVMTIGFTTAVNIPASGKVTVALAGYSTLTADSCRFTSPASVATPTSSALANNVLTITASNAAISAGATVITCTGVTNPAKKAALSNVAIYVKNSADADVSTTDVGTLPAILGALSSATVTLSTRNSQATSVTVTIGFTTGATIAASGKIAVKLSNFAWPAPVCAFTAPVSQAAPASAAYDTTTGDLTITNSATAVAAGATTLTCTGATNPATQVASSTVDIRTQTSLGVNSERVMTATLPAIVPKITSAAITFASGAKASTSTTMTITMTTTTTVPINGKIIFALGSAFTFGDTNSCVITGSAGATKGAAGSSSTLTITPAASVASGSVVITCSGVTLPASQSAKTDMQVTLQNATPVDQEWTNAGTIPAITATATLLTNPVITLSSDVATASGVTLTVSFTNPTAIPLSGKVVVPLASFTTTADACKFTSPASTANPASATYAANTLTVTLASSGAIAANSAVVMTCTGVTNPAAQAALTNVQIKTQDAQLADLDSTIVGTLPAILHAITSAAITLSNPNAALTGVTVTASFTTASQIPASGKILIKLPNYQFNTPVCAITTPASTVAPTSSAYSGTDMTITLSANALAAGSVVLTCTNATNPSAQAALTNGDIRTQTSAGVNLDRTLTATFPAVTGVITAASIMLSSYEVSKASVTATISFTTVTATPFSGRVTVGMSGFTMTANSCKVTLPTGVLEPVSSAIAADLLTVTLNSLAGGAIAAGPVTITCTGITNPSAARKNTSNIQIFTQSALSANLDSTYAATLLQITPAINQLALGAITLSNRGEKATGVVMTTTFISSQAIPSSGKIKLTLTGTSWAATSPVCTFTEPSVLGNSAALASNALTITIPGGAAAGSIFTFTCTGITNPATTDANTATIATLKADDSSLDSTTTATIPTVTAVGLISPADITLSNASAGQTSVTMTATFTTVGTVGNSGLFIFATSTLIIPASPSCKFTSPTADIATAVYANQVLTITLAATASVSAGSVAFTCTGINTPAAQLKVSNLAWTTRSSVGNDIDRTATATVVAITGVGAISSGSITLSDNTAAATGVLATITLVTATELPASGKIVVPMAGFAFTSSTCKFLAPAATADAASVTFASPDLTIMIGAGKIAAGTLTLNCTGVTNPPAQTDKTLLHFRTTTSGNVLVDEGKVGTLVTIKPANGALGASAVTLSNAAQGAHDVRANVSVVVAQGIPAAGSIRVSLTNFNNTNNATIVCSFTAPTNVNATGTWFSGVLSVTLNTGSSINNGTTVMFSCTGLQTPVAKQSELTNVVIETYAGSVLLDKTLTGTLVAITEVTSLTKGAVTLSNTQAGVTGVTVSTSFTSASGIVNNGRVVVHLPGFRWPADPACTFSKPSALANTAKWASGYLTITLGAAVNGTAGDYVFTCTGATNPAVAQANNTNTVISVANAAGTDTERQTTATLVAVLAPPVNFKTQPALVSKTDTTLSITVSASNSTDQLRCLAQNASLAAPTAASIFSEAASTLSPNKTATTGNAQTVAFSNLKSATEYKVWCALEGANLLSTALNVTTLVAGAASFTAEPSLSAKTTAEITISFTASTNKDAVRCQARASGAAAPTAADVLAGTGAVISSNKENTTGVAQTVIFANLTSNTTYSVYCALEIMSVLSTALTVKTDAVVVPVVTGNLYFVAGSSSFSGANTDFTVSVGFLKADGSVDTTPTAAITLSSVPAGVTATALTVTPTAGVAKFTAKIATVGSYVLTASATGFRSVDRSFKVQAPPTGAPVLAFFADPKTNTFVYARRAFAVQPVVTIQDSAGSVFSTGASSTLSVTLAGTGLAPAAGLTKAAVAGLAAFTGLYIETVGSTTITATATGATSVSTTVTVSRAFGYYAFTASPSFETTNVVFAVQPVVTSFGTDGVIFTTQQATLTLAAAAAIGTTGTVVLTSGTATTAPSQGLTNGVASFAGVKAVATTGTYTLTASASPTVSVSTRFNIYADAAASATASASERSTSWEFKLKLGLDASVVDNPATKAQYEAAIRSDLCLAAGLTVANCNIQVTIVKASVTATVVVLNNADASRPSPKTIADLLVSQVSNPASPLRNSPTAGQLESFVVAVPSQSQVKAGSASTAAVASATFVAAGVMAALLL